LAVRGFHAWGWSAGSGLLLRGESGVDGGLEGGEGGGEIGEDVPGAGPGVGLCAAF
jgi:hypothetical protein